MHGASHTTFAISFQSIRKELGIMHGACDPQQLHKPSQDLEAIHATRKKKVQKLA